MRLFPKIALAYLLFFMGLLVWVVTVAFTRPVSGRTGIDMVQLQKKRSDLVVK